MEARRRRAAGDRSALRISPAGALRRRARGADRRAGCCRRCGWSSTTKCVAAAGRRRRGRAARPCTRRSIADGRPCRLPDADPGGVRMKALVTGAAGFIGSHLAAALLDARRGGRRPRLLHRLLPARDQGSATSRRLRGAARLPTSSRRAFRTRDLAGAARRHDARLPSGGAGRRAQELGARLPDLHRATTSTRRSGCSKPASDRPLERFVYASSSSVYGDNAAMPMREDALPQPVSPYGVTKLAAEQLCHLYLVNHGVPATSLRYFTVYGPRQRPDMGFHRFITAALDGRADHAVRRRRADPRLHVRRRRRGGHDRRRRPRRARAASITSAADRACR